MITTTVSLNQVTVRALIIILIIKRHYHLTRHKKLSETILGSKKSYEANVKKKFQTILCILYMCFSHFGKQITLVLFIVLVLSISPCP